MKMINIPADIVGKKLIRFSCCILFEISNIIVIFIVFLLYGIYIPTLIVISN